MRPGLASPIAFLAPRQKAVKHSSTIYAFWRMAGGYWQRRDAQLLSLALAVLVVCQIIVAVLLNIWCKDFFNALDIRSQRCLDLIPMLLMIVAVNTLLPSMHLGVKRRLVFGWREWLTKDILRHWMSEEHHHHKLNHAVPHLDTSTSNPDARIAVDIANATECAVELVNSFFYNALQLVSFLVILWGLSRTFILPWGITFTGSLVVIAFVYAIFGNIIAFKLAKKLAHVTEDRLGREADFRSQLGHASRTSHIIASKCGELQMRERLSVFFREIAWAWLAQTRRLFALSVFTAPYTALAALLPILVGVPSVLGGTLMLGGLLQAGDAFKNATGALSCPVDNAGRIGEWSASASRILKFHEAMKAVEAADCKPQRLASKKA